MIQANSFQFWFRHIQCKPIIIPARKVSLYKLMASQGDKVSRKASQEKEVSGKIMNVSNKDR